MNASSFRRCATLTLVVSSIAATLALGASCIIPDRGIVVLKNGARWCANAEGARAWVDSFINSETLLDNEGRVIQGCGCFDDEELNKLEQWNSTGAPSPTDPDYSLYVNLRDKILLAARTACDEQAQARGFNFNNCTAVIPDTDELFSNGTSSECQYRESVVDTDSVDTDSAATDGGDTESSPAPFDLSGLSCRGRSCRAPRSLVEDMLARPEAFLLDDTRIDIRTDGSLVFENVSRGDVAYIAGLRTGDTLLKINGYYVASLDEVATLLVELRNATRISITVKNRHGKKVKTSLSIY